MCGRYVLKATLKELEKKYGAVSEGNFLFEPNYNVALLVHMPVMGEGRLISISDPESLGIEPL